MKGIWISEQEIAALPTSGAAWLALKAAADTPAGTPDLSDQNDGTNVIVLAKALVYAKTGEAQYRTEVETACLAAIDTELGGRTLALGRELAAYVIAADLITLVSPAFFQWLRRCLTETLSGRTLQSTQDDRPNNWGTHAGASRAAVAAFLGDLVELDRCAVVFRGYLGDRQAYANFSYGDLAWQSDPANPRGINPVGATIQGRNVDGVMPDDQRRAGGFAWPPPKENYAWEGLQGAVVCAEILHRAGYPAWEWEGRAIFRAVTWLIEQAQYPPEGDDQWQIPLINHRCGTIFPAGSANSRGKNMAWTGWTHSGDVVIIPPDEGPKITALAPDHGEIGEPVRLHGSGFVNVDVVRFADANANFVVGGGTWIDTWVPLTASTGRVEVHTATGSAISPGEFTVMVEPPPPPTDPDARVSLLLQALAELSAEQADSWRRFGLKVNVIQGGS